jgi:hypothetical protein
MIHRTSEQLSGARSIFAVANTPLFLVRKLRFDSATQTLGNFYSSVDLFDSLVSAVSKRPTDINEAVLPYVYLVALSMRPDAGVFLKRASSISPVSDYEWFGHISGYLAQAYDPVQSVVIKATPWQSPSYSIDGGAPSERARIILPGAQFPAAPQGATTPKVTIISQ